MLTVTILIFSAQGIGITADLVITAIFGLPNRLETLIGNRTLTQHFAAGNIVAMSPSKENPDVYDQFLLHPLSFQIWTQQAELPLELRKNLNFLFEKMIASPQDLEDFYLNIEW